MSKRATTLAGGCINKRPPVSVGTASAAACGFASMQGNLIRLPLAHRRRLPRGRPTHSTGSLLHTSSAQLRGPERVSSIKYICDDFIMAVHPQVQAVAFQLTLQKFKATLSDQEKKSFGVTSLHDLHVAMETIQRKQKSERKLRAMSKLARFLEGMKEYDKIVTVFLNTSELLAFVWVRSWHTNRDL